MDVERMLKELCADVGYAMKEVASDETLMLEKRINQQSPDIAQAVGEGDKLGAGDQGGMVGYATDETPERILLPVVLAQRICRRLDESDISWLKPDGKAQVTVVYHQDDEPVAASAVVVSVQHDENVEIETIRRTIREEIIRRIGLNRLKEGSAIEFNPTDSRIRIREDDICQTLCSRMGTGGNCVPLVFGISSDQSNAMLSDNPHSGVYEAQTSRTLDCNGGSAACNQGGMVVVEPTYALTAGEYTALGREQTPPLMARDYKDPMIVNCHAEEVPYLVRRLTPLECCRLQGFPGGWTEDLGTERPNEQEIARWVGVFEDWYRAQGKATRASPGRVTKWLKDPHNDAAQYKAYGNSVAVPCVFFVLAGIVWAEERDDEA